MLRATVVVQDEGGSIGHFYPPAHITRFPTPILYSRGVNTVITHPGRCRRAEGVEPRVRSPC